MTDQCMADDFAILIIRCLFPLKCFNKMRSIWYFVENSMDILQTKKVINTYIQSTIRPRKDIEKYNQHNSKSCKIRWNSCIFNFSSLLIFCITKTSWITQTVPFCVFFPDTKINYKMHCIDYFCVLIYILRMMMVEFYPLN